MTSKLDWGSVSLLSDSELDEYLIVFSSMSMDVETARKFAEFLEEHRLSPEGIQDLDDLLEGP